MKTLTVLFAAGVLATQASHAAMISLYQFDGSTADSVRGAGYGAELLGGQLDYTQGISGQAFRFNGSTILRAPLAGGGLSAFSFSAWVNFQDYGTWSSVVKNWGDPNVGAFHLGIHESTDYISSFLGNDQGGAEAVFSGSLSLDIWYHLGVTIGQTSQSLYIDGQLVAQGLTPGTLNSDFGFMSFGAKLDNAQEEPAPSAPGWLDGYLDDVAFFNEELSPEQMSLVYQGGLVGSSINETLTSPVPEPGSAFALAGLLGGGMFLRRRKGRAC